jgi:hypothetical protein
MGKEKKVKQLPMPKYISLKVCDELYGLVAKEADRDGINLIDIVVRALAEHFNRADLNWVPRKPQGRKRTKQPA